MSSACSCPVSIPNSFRSVPGEPNLAGHETLDDFVRMIAIREGAKPKRDRLPELAPVHADQVSQPSLLRRFTRSLFCV